MDTRTDPGQYYPGGRVMVRPDVAPPQAKVNWSDIEGKPDFSDIPELEAADSDDNVKTAVNKIVDKMTTAVIVLLCGLCAALSAPAATMLNYMSGTNEVYTAAETDAAIVRLAPATGNYAAVSNAAMNALSRAEAEAGFMEWVCSLPEAYPQWNYNENEWMITIPGDDDFFTDNKNPNATNLTATAHGSTITATRTRLPTMAELDGKASTNDVQLTPVYGGNGERFGEWRFSGDGVVPTSTYSISIRFRDDYALYDYALYVDGATEDSYYDESDSLLTVSYSLGSGYITATRTRTDIIGYTLGSQTDKVLPPTNDLARASDLAAVRAVADAAASTNAQQTAQIAFVARSATNYTDSVFADATNRIAALEAELQGLANALHVINTGTNLVTGGGN